MPRYPLFASTLLATACLDLECPPRWVPDDDGRTCVPVEAEEVEEPEEPVPWEAQAVPAPGRPADDPGACALDITVDPECAACLAGIAVATFETDGEGGWTFAGQALVSPGATLSLDLRPDEGGDVRFDWSQLFPIGDSTNPCGFPTGWTTELLTCPAGSAETFGFACAAS